ncbi:MAG: S-adenosylmethionine:tRNA ribosyltransferase-isomerase [Tannerellaceae bacterium]|jgi:S-adenosylmethionine:tRNA ribosyltransferase-isomerase|nr:S-adenosylmethionine:tRNA ribosyltransferase-isomerase [Tannerellaceae bacterium]
MTTETRQIRIDDFLYTLPDARIAKYPLFPRDESRLLLYRGGRIAEAPFRRLPDCLPPQAMLVFNNTRVIRARMIFRKETGARIELFCLEPADPADYAQAFLQTRSCEWYCMAGNLKRWKDGVLLKTVDVDGTPVGLTAERLASCGGTHRIRFAWDADGIPFGLLLEKAGVLPIPPYLHRETEEADLDSYQTVYARVKGSVAAPTAGLHFTPEVLAALDAAGFVREELTLHVGAGTFKPVQTDTLEEHRMHTEYFSVSRQTVERIRSYTAGRIVAVGTTSARTLESLYYAGLILSRHPEAPDGLLTVPQWMPYDPDSRRLPADEALRHLLDYMDRNQSDSFTAATQIMIAPGYTFRIARGLITNFHQPRSTLLLLISAFVGDDWRRIYDYALANNFRFLSYGDSSLLLPD